MQINYLSIAVRSALQELFANVPCSWFYRQPHYIVTENYTLLSGTAVRAKTIRKSTVVLPQKRHHHCLREGGTLGIPWWGTFLTLFQTKNVIFPHPFPDLASKIHTCFQTWPLKKLCYYRGTYEGNEIFKPYKTKNISGL